ncbi:MAG: hypothetical protein KY461_10935 [Actinobacteria bacterium]|nr:hypothetical protein [Actinomycetota bacterium]
MVGFLYLSSGLFAPGWAVLVLLLAWAALAWLIWRWRRRGIVVLAIPFVAVALLLLVATAGDRLLGWTA